MSTLDINQFSDIGDLWGRWSALATIVGLLGARASFRSQHPRTPSREDGDAPRIIAALPWLMLLLAFFLGFFVLGGTQAYSGPPSMARTVRPYEIQFATLIAFVFGFVFAFDALRFRKLRRQASTWICIAIYIYVGIVLVSPLLRKRNDDTPSSDHRSEPGRAISVAGADALDRPRRSVLVLARL